MPHCELSQLRLQLVSQGYQILPNRGKVPVMHGWNRPETIAREANKAERWERRFPDALSTGLLICDGIGVIDIDVDDEAAVLWILDRLRQIAPWVHDKAPVRFGGGKHKIALFCRIEGELFVRLASRRYLNGYCVEIFGGARLSGNRVSRQFGIFGPHSYNGSDVAIEYRWARDEPELHEVAAADLPVLTRDQANELINSFDQLAAMQGWRVDHGAPLGTGSVVYDIDDETRFDTDKGGIGLSYAELCEEQAIYGQLRCSSNFMPGRDGAAPTRCRVAMSEVHGCVGVWVDGDATWHLPVSRDPEHDRALLAQRLVEIEAVTPQAAAAAEDEPAEPGAGASLDEQGAWLIQTRAYCEGGDAIVRLYADTLDCQTTPSAFHRRYRHFQQPAVDRRTKRPTYATDLWEASPSRQNVAGVRMRPDMPFPVYADSGQLFKNIYRRPRHAGGGDIAPFSRFMERFIPDARERDWLLDWMAHKQARPDIPGTSVFFVADTEEGIREGSFGTGRGLMFRIVRKLYGSQYTRAQSFGMLDGSSSQSTFNDWLHGSVLVTVDESKSSPTSYRRGERSAAYEVLKDIVDPAPKLHRFNGKNRQAFDGMSYCSVWVATNHSDAMAIPENDRRFTVLRNGRAILPAEAAEIATWMEVPANIGALAEALTARDLTSFEMFEPLGTASKAEMAELARSDVEELLRDLMADPELGLAFTKDQLERRLEYNSNGQWPHMRGEFRSAWHTYCVGLKGPSGGPRRLFVQGTQKKLFTFRDRRRRVEALPEVALRREASKWGGVDLPKSLAEMVGLGKKDA